jgi:hypothetical protein
MLQKFRIGEEDMRCAAITVSALLCLVAPAHAEVLVSISKSQQRLSVMVDGTEAYRWPVSTGRRGNDTPSGKFRPTRLERHWYSRQYEMTPMPFAVFFHRGYAVHGTMEAHNLGTVASHGCVRLRPDNAAILYSLIRRQGMANTRVVVMNGNLPAVPTVPAVPAAPMPSGVPMADTPATGPIQHFVAAGDREEFAAKTHGVADDAEADDAVSRRNARFARTVSYRVSISSSETQILRERDAWLKSLDRKYGITR